MSVPKIPENLNPELLSRSDAGQSTRDIAEWLVEAKHLTSCSHMKVARRLQTLRAAEAAPAKATEEDIERLLRANGELVGDTIESLIDLEEAATFGDEARGLKPDLPLAERLARRRASMVENRQKYLMVRLTMAREAKRLEEFRQRQEARHAETRAKLQQTVGRTRTEFGIAPQPRRAAPPAPPVPPAPEPKHSEATPGRNAPCPCGSGRKWKKCHGGLGAGAVTPAVTLASQGVLRASTNPIG